MSTKFQFPRATQGWHHNTLPLKGRLQECCPQVCTYCKRRKNHMKPYPPTTLTIHISPQNRFCAQISAAFWDPPSYGGGQGSEEESGRKKETAASPSQPGISPNSFDLHFIHKVQQELLSFLSSPLPWKKMDKKSLPSFILANHLPYPCQFCWGAEAVYFAGLQNPLRRQLSLPAFSFNSHLKPSELLQSITKCPLNFAQNQILNFKNIYLDLKDVHSNFWLHGQMIWQTTHT